MIIASIKKPVQETMIFFQLHNTILKKFLFIFWVTIFSISLISIGTPGIEENVNWFGIILGITALYCFYFVFKIISEYQILRREQVSFFQKLYRILLTIIIFFPIFLINTSLWLFFTNVFFLLALKTPLRLVAKNTIDKIKFFSGTKFSFFLLIIVTIIGFAGTVLLQIKLENGPSEDLRGVIGATILLSVLTIFILFIYCSRRNDVSYYKIRSHLPLMFVLTYGYSLIQIGRYYISQSDNPEVNQFNNPFNITITLGAIFFVLHKSIDLVPESDLLDLSTKLNFWDNMYIVFSKNRFSVIYLVLLGFTAAELFWKSSNLEQEEFDLISSSFFNPLAMLIFFTNYSRLVKNKNRDINR